MLKEQQSILGKLAHCLPPAQEMSSHTGWSWSIHMLTKHTWKKIQSSSVVKELGEGMFWVALDFLYFLFLFLFFYVSTPVEAQPGAFLLPFEIFIVLCQPIKGRRTRMVPSNFTLAFLIFATFFAREHKWTEMKGKMILRNVAIIIVQGPVVQSAIKLPYYRKLTLHEINANC